MKNEFFGALVKQAREKKHWTKGDLAIHAEVGSSTVSRIESGSIPRMDATARIVIALELDAKLVIGALARRLDGRTFRPAYLDYRDTHVQNTTSTSVSF